MAYIYSIGKTLADLSITKNQRGFFCVELNKNKTMPAQAPGCESTLWKMQ